MYPQVFVVFYCKMGTAVRSPARCTPFVPHGPPAGRGVLSQSWGASSSSTSISILDSSSICHFCSASRAAARAASDAADRAASRAAARATSRAAANCSPDTSPRSHPRFASIASQQRLSVTPDCVNARSAQRQAISCNMGASTKSSRSTSHRRSAAGTRLRRKMSSAVALPPSLSAYRLSLRRPFSVLHQHGAIASTCS